MQSSSSSPFPPSTTKAPALGELKSHILILAALHPELKMTPEAQHLVDGFKQSHPEAWKQVQNPYRDIIDPYDAKIKMTDDRVETAGRDECA